MCTLRWHRVYLNTRPSFSVPEYVIVQRQEEARRPRVALPASPSPQLVVHPTALVPRRPHHVQAAELEHLVTVMVMVTGRVWARVEAESWCQGHGKLPRTSATRRGRWRLESLREGVWCAPDHPASTSLFICCLLLLCRRVFPSSAGKGKRGMQIDGVGAHLPTRIPGYVTCTFRGGAPCSLALSKDFCVLNLP